MILKSKTYHFHRLDLTLHRHGLRLRRRMRKLLAMVAVLRPADLRLLLADASAGMVTRADRAPMLCFDFASYLLASGATSAFGAANG